MTELDGKVFNSDGTPVGARPDDRSRRFAELRRARVDPCLEGHNYQLQDRWFEGQSAVGGEVVATTDAARIYVMVCAACADVREVRKEGSITL